jgi:hypothetical protein
MVLLASACVPAATPTLNPTSPALPTKAVTVPSATQPLATVIPTAVATSRGPDLEATDPLTVNIASGNLQLIEFFRFT